MTAASARSHTRANRVKSSSFPAMIAPIAVAWTVSHLRWVYQALEPPPQRYQMVHLSLLLELGSVMGGSWLTGKLEFPRKGLSTKLLSSMALTAPEIWLTCTSTYGDSDPNPTCIVKSEAYDVQELADKLQIGSMFYVIGISMGAYPVYTFLKYIPHRHVAQFVYKLQ